MSTGIQDLQSSFSSLDVRCEVLYSMYIMYTAEGVRPCTNTDCMYTAEGVRSCTNTDSMYIYS